MKAKYYVGFNLADAAVIASGQAYNGHDSATGILVASFMDCRKAAFRQDLLDRHQNGRIVSLRTAHRPGVEPQRPRLAEEARAFAHKRPSSAWTLLHVCHVPAIGLLAWLLSNLLWRLLVLLGGDAEL